MVKASPFAHLFKQSKFSSFDRQIAQVYTTHGGDAHRGDWGFKRPLSIRRRGAYITVKNVDTPEHQTEWNSAEPQALWTKNWDELKITPQWEPRGMFSGSGYTDEARDHIQESDYVPNQRDPSSWRRAYIPNIVVMSRQEFGRYVAQAQTRRHQFYNDIQRREGRRNPAGLSFYQLGNSYASGWDELYAQYLSRKRRADPRNREIEHMPHRSGGLSYANYTPLQTFLMTKERKGRLADEYIGKDKKKLFYLASFARMTGIVQKGNAGAARPMVWDDAQRTGETTLRPQHAVIHRLPSVVGRVRQGLKGAKLDMELRVWDGQSHSRSNPHPPGSRQYIAAEPPGFSTGLTVTRKRRMDAFVAQSKAHPGPSGTLDILGSIIKRNGS